MKDRFGYQSVKINYKLNFDVPKDSDCFINVEFLQKGLFQAKDGSIIGQMQFNPLRLPEYRVKGATQEMYQSTADSIQTVMLGFLIANLIASFVMGDGMMHMWFLINQLQIVYYIPLIDINFHTNAKFVFSLLVFAMADFLD